ITATQMDIKVDGLSYDVLQKALEQARLGRMHIMGEMMKTISEPRAELKPHTPRIVQIIIPGEFIGAVIGKGGEVIQNIQKTTQTTVTISEQKNAEGTTVGAVDIFGENKENMDAALAWIKGIITVPEAGTIYKGKVVSILDFGAFVEVLPGKEGLLHISEIDWKKVEKTEDVLHVGDEVEVKLLEIEETTAEAEIAEISVAETEVVEITETAVTIVAHVAMIEMTVLLEAKEARLLLEMKAEKHLLQNNFYNSEPQGNK
ncbi:MAG: S1 RNA-binding domain-containing protein, partial [Bacteroidales bacterium]